MSSSEEERRERRTKQRLDSEGTSRRVPPPRSPSPLANERRPWPRNRDEPIPINREFADVTATCTSRAVLDRPITEDWDIYDSLFYNAWLGVEIKATRFAHAQTMRRLGITDTITAMMEQLGLGTMATHAHDLHPSLVRQFMATVRYEDYSTPSSDVCDGMLSFFARGIRHRISLEELCLIYGFQFAGAGVSNINDFPSYSALWDIIGTGAWNSYKAVQNDIRHPAVRYFMRILSSTLVCKMEPNKVRIHELTLLFHALDGLVPLLHLDPDALMRTPHLGAVFAQHLVDLKTKPFKGTSQKTETIGSLLTPIFFFCDIDFDPEDAVPQRRFLDETHLRSSTWMTPDRDWRYRTLDGQQQLFRLPNRAVTDFDQDIERLRFLPAVPPRPAPPIRRTRAASSTSTHRTGTSRLPPFPEIPPVPMEEPGVFQKVVVDALHAIWASVRRCRCSSRSSTSASDPGPSHQYREDDDDDEDDEE